MPSRRLSLLNNNRRSRKSKLELEFEFEFEFARARARHNGCGPLVAAVRLSASYAALLYLGGWLAQAGPIRATPRSQ